MGQRCVAVVRIVEKAGGPEAVFRWFHSVTGYTVQSGLGGDAACSAHYGPS
jgi:hypothetical protein